MYSTTFIPPTVQDLEQLYNPSDKYPPSQSKRWAHMRRPDSSQKPPSRSHHRQGSMNETADGRRSTRGRAPPALGKPISHSRESMGKDVKRKSVEPTHRRKVSMGGITSPSASRSPPPHGHAPPKRRSTMNSRDAAYEEQVQAALKASRMESLGAGGDDDEEGEECEAKEVEEHEVEMAPKKGKRKRDEEENGECVGWVSLTLKTLPIPCNLLLHRNPSILINTHIDPSLRRQLKELCHLPPEKSIQEEHRYLPCPLLRNTITVRDAQVQLQMVQSRLHPTLYLSIISIGISRTTCHPFPIFSLRLNPSHWSHGRHGP